MKSKKKIIKTVQGETIERSSPIIERAYTSYVVERVNSKFEDISFISKNFGSILMKKFKTFSL